VVILRPEIGVDRLSRGHVMGMLDGVFQRHCLAVRRVALVGGDRFLTNWRS
jgi:hypothetical protein